MKRAKRNGAKSRRTSKPARRQNKTLAAKPKKWKLNHWLNLGGGIQVRARKVAGKLSIEGRRTK